MIIYDQECYTVLRCMHVHVQVSQCMRYGARVEQHGTDISEAKTYAMDLAKKEKLRYVNG